MTSTTRTRMATVGFLAVATLGLSACGSDAEEMNAADTAAEAPAMTPEPEATEDMGDDMADEDMTAEPATTLVGPGCAAYAEAVPDGPGSVAGMAQDPVAVAASNNPMLTTLVSAVSGELNPDVNLVDTLNGDEFTVFAPVDEAFAAIDPATIETLKTDADMLSSILTYHVVPGQLSPDMVVGEQTTVQGGTVEVTGEGDTLMVNGAHVVCGGVQTANATVYLIDGVLMPTM
ncbi:fasciclin domain-containing protein [uncultured Cellulomonas sp.]|uniref:fasciclin domain-containing protein n=1 Tax=uncultured Cellulomonas sp. TaxID=189682 RepID=UPI00260357B9|nr:fasciclin domain-containing protein [uncultured Cellulomonas sp.]